MPYSSTNGCALMPTSQQTTEAAGYKILSYSAIYAADITAIKSMVASKHPVMTPVNIDANFYNAGPGYIWNSYSGYYNSHMVTICGYDDAKHAFKAVNSWGTSWGEAGYIWIDYDFLSTVCYQAYVMSL
jgi:C1A family cysteine protease